MKLDEMIEITENYRYTICCGEHVEDDIRELLLELKDRRETELKPATKFLGNTTDKQFAHIRSELIEAWEIIELLCIFPKTADNYGERVQEAAEELIDLQMTCCTMLAILGLDESQRREARRKVIEKNRSRGYYEEEGC
jgi:hypothetical protein